MSNTKQEFEKITSPDALMEEGYRKGVGMVLTKNGKVFVAERSDSKGAWQMPQGGADEGEDLLAAARRELLEETGLTKETMELVALHADWTAYELPKKFQKGENNRNFKGQVQKWFLFRFNEDDSVIDLSKAHDKEFTNWKWVTPEEAIETAVDFRKPVYEQIFSVFNHSIHDDAS